MNSEIGLVQKIALQEYSKTEGGPVKKYPSLELVRIDKKLFGDQDKSKFNVLEYAIGGGCNTEYLIQEGYNVSGVDVTDIAIKTTESRIARNTDKKKKLNLYKLDADAKKLNFKNNSFDLVVAMSVLSLLGEEARIRLLLAEFKRVMKQNSKIIIDINDQNSEFSYNKKQIDKNVFMAGPFEDNICCYCMKSENDFIDLIGDYFKVLDSGYSSHKLFGKRINEWIICAEKI